MKNILYNYFCNLSNFLSGLFFPILCIICKKDNTYLCSDCERKLELPKGKINNWTYSKYKYQNKYLKKIEYALKYNHHPNLGISLGEYSYKFLEENILKKIYDKEIFLIPIPISKNRLKQRGYNQAFYIANGILKESKNKNNSKLEILDILDRKETDKLKDVYGIDNRLEKIKNSMSVKKDAHLKSDAFYILIDDITTTGSTFYEARRALEEYGIIEKNIYAYSVAH